jgi:MarR family transcriptional regulator, temperature-dependent positive regulator of motility
MSGNKDAKSLSRSFSHLLKRAVQYSVHRYNEESGKSGLTHRQFTVLAAVDSNDGKSQTELVKITGIDRSTLADMVARLMAQGLVQRRRTKEDARTNSVRVTPQGKKLLKSAQSGAEEVDKQLLAMFPTADRKTLIDCLSELSTALDKIDDVEEEPKPAAKIKLKRRVTA